jgi:hypothetical protein
MTLRATISITILLSSPLTSAGYDQACHFPSFSHPIWHASGRSSAENHAQTHRGRVFPQQSAPTPVSQHHAAPAAPDKFP